MNGPNWFNEFVASIYVDLGERSDYSVGYLSSWFLDPANLGVLNNQTDNCFAAMCLTGDKGMITGYDIQPSMTSAELSIYKANFDVFFYGREAKRALQNSYGSASWTTLREGDSSVTRINRSDLARTFNALQKDAREQVGSLVKEYLRNHSRPQSVDGNDYIPGSYYNPVSNSIAYPRSEPSL